MNVRRSLPRFAFVAAVALVSFVAVEVLAQNTGQQQGAGRGRGISAERLMEMDADGDGKLSRSEMPGRLADRMFDAADADGDGLLDRTEIEAYFADRLQGRGQRERGGRGEGGDAAFERHMSTLGRSMRGLSRTTFEPKIMDDNLALVDALQASLVGAKRTLRSVEMAAQAKQKYDGDARAYRAAFRVQLHKTLAESLELERAVLQSDAAAAKASIRRLVELRDEGHAAFQGHEEEEHEEGGEHGGDHD